MRIFRHACMVLALLVATAMPTVAATQTKNGSIDVSGQVNGPPPANAPTIDVPAPNTTFTQKTVDVKGGCDTGLVVRIFRNAVFAGSALCQSTNTYSLQIDLAEGRNDLVARQYDFANQSSPDSNTVSVFFAPPATQPQLPNETPNQDTSGQPANGGGTSGGQNGGQSGQQPGSETAQFQLIIDYDYSFQGVTVNNPFHLPIHFLGGTPPYAVSVYWGDGNQSVFSRENTDQFFADHTYSKPGAYTIKLRVSDKNGNQAFLQFVLIVNGKKSFDDTVLFGLPTSFMAWLKVIWVPLGFGLAGFLFGFFFSDYWKRKKNRQDKKPAKRKRSP